MNKRLDIDLLRTLKAVNDLGGVTRAAQHLSLSQSAVSHKIRRFENNLGCSLLRRDPGQELLTDDGKQLVTFAERIISIHDEALSAINKPALRGSIRLGITEELVSSGLAEILGRYRRLFPELKVNTIVEQSLVLDQKLKLDELDMAVMQVFVDDVKPQDTLLYRQSLHWLSSAGFTDDDSTPLPFIAFNQHCFYRQWAERAMREIGRPMDIVLECASNQGIRRAVESGMGIALLGAKQRTQTMVEAALPRPPDIAFVIRCNEMVSGEHLQVLQDDVKATLTG